jgi:hypothetical protein
MGVDGRNSIGVGHDDGVVFNDVSPFGHGTKSH